MTWQPEPEESGEDAPPGPEWAQEASGELPAGPDPDDPGYRRVPRRRRLTAMIVLLVVALCGLALGAAGVARQVLPRQFSALQQQKIETWEMARRWRAMPAGQIFPAAASYVVPASALNASQGLTLTASRLGIAQQGSCATDVSAAAAPVLRAGHCAALLRATYLDASGSFVITLGVAVLPDKADAEAAEMKLTMPGSGQRLAVRVLPVADSPAARFHNAGREFSVAFSAGPYVVMATAGFADGRLHVELGSDYYYNQEMTSLAEDLADSLATRIGTQPAVPSCPGAPGC